MMTVIKLWALMIATCFVIVACGQFYAVMTGQPTTDESGIWPHYQWVQGYASGIAWCWWLWPKIKAAQESAEREAP